jgi:hypothetical protein
MNVLVTDQEELIVFNQELTPGELVELAEVGALHELKLVHVEEKSVV